MNLFPMKPDSPTQEDIDANQNLKTRERRPSFQFTK